MVSTVGKPSSVQLLIQGGDARFLADRLIEDWDPDVLGEIRIKDLERFSKKVLGLTQDELVRDFHISNGYQQLKGSCI